jgi:hypothetical protein
MSDRMSEVPDLEAPTPDAFEQSLPVDDVAEDAPPVERVLATDPEVPDADAIEQSLPAPIYDDEDWR